MNGFYRSIGKRALDLLIALPALVVAAPLVAVAGTLVRLDSPGPVLFVQDRLGRDGRVFRIYKLRTLIDEPRVPDREILIDDPELTRVGAWLRRFKIDELPQAWNVVIGDMSIVGPRPPLPSQLDDYDTITRRRLEVRPGLTGLAQVSGSIQLSWPERWRYDVRYVDRVSLGTDLAIILRTLKVILVGEHLSDRGDG